ncbi:MAG: HDOD domain-containing protein [Terracidiphilus sp.]
MSPRAVSTSDEPRSAQAEPAEALRYVARQPILDASGEVHAYELLFRSGPESVFRGDKDQATRTMLDNTVIFGMETLTGGLPAFVNCTLDSLTGKLVELFPPRLTVLEILETVEPSPALFAACHKLKSFGYQLALDDFVWAPRYDPLLELADYVKVDFTLSGPAERKELFRRVKRPVTFLAEKIETQEQYKEALKEGFTLFQGYYFCRPTLLRSHKIPANDRAYLELLKLLQEQPLDLAKVSQIVKHDAALTYRLLRLVNSPLYAVRQQVSSIRSAIRAVGEDAFRHLASLAITSEFTSGQTSELMRMALVRARFCELVAGHCALDPTEQYLLGMFSLLPAMLRIAMSEIVPSLPLRPEICDALLGTNNHERCPLGWIEAWEQADWSRCDSMARHSGVDADHLARCAKDAVAWANKTLSAAA